MDVTPVLGYLGEVDISQLKLNPEEVRESTTSLTILCYDQFNITFFKKKENVYD